MIAGNLTQTPVGSNPVGTTVRVSDVVTDNNIRNVEWHWNDGVVTKGSFDAATNTVYGVRTFKRADVYTVTLKVTGHCDKPAEYTYPGLIVIYDPNGDFITGGGWINFATGKASFEFDAKYKPGTHIATGMTEFYDRAGKLKFKSTSYEWLVVAGSKAKFKGMGSINGSGNYEFMVTSTDGSSDLFRIKIWNADAVVYDTKMGDSDDSYSGIELGGGSIVIHDAKSQDARYDEGTTAGVTIAEKGLEMPAAFKLKVYPNPLQQELAIELESDTEEEVTISFLI